MPPPCSPDPSSGSRVSAMAWCARLLAGARQLAVPSGVSPRNGRAPCPLPPVSNTYAYALNTRERCSCSAWATSTRASTMTPKFSRMSSGIALTSRPMGREEGRLPAGRCAAPPARPLRRAARGGRSPSGDRRASLAPRPWPHGASRRAGRLARHRRHRGRRRGDRPQLARRCGAGAGGALHDRRARAVGYRALRRDHGRARARAAARQRARR